MKPLLGVAFAALVLVGCSGDGEDSNDLRSGGDELEEGYDLEGRLEGALPATFGIGRPASAAEIAAVDIDIMPDGRGLPPGSGGVAAGEALYQARCAACHGADLEGGASDRLVTSPDHPGFPDGEAPTTARAIGNYWPYATTLFDYVRRAMPFDRPGSLADEEVYALTAYLLWRNGIVEEDAVMDAATLPAVVMPARDRFVVDDRLESDRVR